MVSRAIEISPEIDLWLSRGEKCFFKFLTPVIFSYCPECGIFLPTAAFTIATDKSEAWCVPFYPDASPQRITLGNHAGRRLTSCRCTALMDACATAPPGSGDTSSTSHVRGALRHPATPVWNGAYFSVAGVLCLTLTVKNPFISQCYPQTVQPRGCISVEPRWNGLLDFKRKKKNKPSVIAANQE